MDPYALDESEIKRKLDPSGGSSLPPATRYQGYFKTPAQPAAVLIPLLRPFGPRSPWHILLTRRTVEVASHKGQVAFPGGRADPADASPLETALREAWEEIGLESGHVRILGVLDRLHTISNYLVTPVVGVIPWPYSFKLECREVSRIFILPLAWLADPANYQVRTRSVTFPDFGRNADLEVVYFKPYDHETLWGVSAEIVRMLIAKLGIP